MKLKEFLKIQSLDLPADLKLDLGYLISETLDIDSLELSRGSKELTQTQIEDLSAKIAELKDEVPLAYILKSQFFMGLKFYVDQRVLIPRPETEFLVDLCLRGIENEDEITVFDAGAGSGCIGASILALRSKTRCTFLEKSKDAIEVLKINLEKFKIDSSRYQIFESFVDFDNSSNSVFKRIDRFISNPPYIAKDDKALDLNVLVHEPSMALFAEDEGLAYLKAWSIRALSDLRNEESFAIFEFGYGQQNALQSFGNLQTMKFEILLDQYDVPRFWKIQK